MESKIFDNEVTLKITGKLENEESFVIFGEPYNRLIVSHYGTPNDCFKIYSFSDEIPMKLIKKVPFKGGGETNHCLFKWNESTFFIIYVLEEDSEKKTHVDSFTLTEDSNDIVRNEVFCGYIDWGLRRANMDLMKLDEDLFILQPFNVIISIQKKRIFWNMGSYATMKDGKEFERFNRITVFRNTAKSKKFPDCLYIVHRYHVLRVNYKLRKTVDDVFFATEYGNDILSVDVFEDPNDSENEIVVFGGTCCFVICSLTSKDWKFTKRKLQNCDGERVKAIGSRIICVADHYGYFYVFRLDYKNDKIPAVYSREEKLDFDWNHEGSEWIRMPNLLEKEVYGKSIRKYTLLGTKKKNCSSGKDELKFVMQTGKGIVFFSVFGRNLVEAGCEEVKDDEQERRRFLLDGHFGDVSNFSLVLGDARISVFSRSILMM